MKINHFDIGLAHGQEIKYCYDIYKILNVPFNIYGIEAEEYSFNHCKKIYDNLNNIKLFKYAISSSDEEYIKLYLQDNKKNIKQGNSIYASKSNVLKDDYQLVKSIKFSDFLNEHNIELEDSINIIRINIEGAEWDFFNDLFESKLINKFNIFLGAGQQDIWKVKELVDKKIDKKFDELLKINKIKVYRYSFSRFNKNSVLQKLLIEQHNDFSKIFNNDVKFLSIKKNMTIKEYTDFNFEWSISKDMYDNIGNDISLVLQRDNHEKVTYQYLFDICTVNKDITNFKWNIKAGREHNKETKFIVVLFSLENYPNYIGWSEPFNII